MPVASGFCWETKMMNGDPVRPARRGIISDGELTGGAGNIIFALFEVSVSS
jgi:hypothetical protein